MPRGKSLSDAEKAKREQEKANKFKELGAKRMTKALAAMRMMIPLANRAQYTYTPEQVQKIVDAFDAQIEVITNAYAGKEVSTGGFEL